MSEFGADLFRRLQARVHKRSHLEDRRTLISIFPFRPAPPSERLPWEPKRIELTPDERRLVAWLWRELNHKLAPEELISESDVLNFALQELQMKLESENRPDVVLRLGFHLLNVR